MTRLNWPLSKARAGAARCSWKAISLITRPPACSTAACPPITPRAIIALDGAGYVLGFCWHWNAPTNLMNTPGHEWWRAFYTDSTTFDVAAALANTNSAEYSLLLRDIDAIAVQLKKVASSNNIPMLWRPLHEASGGWFWWGAKGPEPFKALWRLLYNRLTTYHNLHNLIWVLTNEDPDWYPGHDVVDIVGVDAYPSDPSDSLSTSWEALKAQFDGVKLLTLSEFGGVPGHGTDALLRRLVVLFLPLERLFH